MLGVGGKMGFDATRKLPAESNGYAVRTWPLELQMDEDVRRRVSDRWAEFGLDG